MAKCPALPASRIEVDITLPYRILSPQKDGIVGQSASSAVLQTPERDQPEDNSEFSAAEPKKGIPIITHARAG